jgi:hypothetical protein
MYFSCPFTLQWNRNEIRFTDLKGTEEFQRGALRLKNNWYFSSLGARSSIVVVLRHYTTSWKVAGSKPDEVIRFVFDLPNPFNRTRPWGLLNL